jgi:AcrR family transcriptional regulator
MDKELSELPRYQTPLRPGKGAQTARGLRRKVQILKVAAELFADQGFDRVSIDDIGHVCGVSGPAVYRYFASKDDLLVAMYDHLYTRSANEIDAIVAEGVSGREFVERLIDGQIRMALEEQEKVRVVDLERRRLPASFAERLHAEARRNTRIWVEAVKKARPELTTDEAEVTVHGVLALINSIALRQKTKAVSPSLEKYLRVMARSAAFGDAPKSKPSIKR